MKKIQITNFFRLFCYYFTVAVVLAATVFGITKIYSYQNLDSNFASLSAQTNEVRQSEKSLIPAAQAAGFFGLETAADRAGLQTEKSLGYRVGSIIKIVSDVLGVVFLLILLTSGFFWMTSGGNEEIIRKSKQAITASVVGFIILTISWTAANFMTGTAIETTNPTPPDIPDRIGACIVTSLPLCTDNEKESLCVDIFAGDGTTCFDVCLPSIGGCDPSISTCYTCQ